MNIAFTSILLFILLAPGFVARIAYNSTKLSVKNPNRNIVNELTWSIVPAIAIHIFAIFLIECLSNYYIDFKLLGNLVLGVSENGEAGQSFIQLKRFIYSIFFYNLSVFSFSFIAGYSANKLIRWLKIDRKIRYFRFSNKWHYIFTGECLDFPDVPDEYEEITDKIINVLCRVNGKTVLYTGEYFNYYVDSNGDLEAIHLKYPIRRYLDDESKDEKKYYQIESRYLVIPYQEIININFRYFNKKEIEEGQLTEEEKRNALSVDPSIYG